jgi:hypothetical protein
MVAFQQCRIRNIIHFAARAMDYHLFKRLGADRSLGEEYLEGQVKLTKMQIALIYQCEVLMYCDSGDILKQ